MHALFVLGPVRNMWFDIMASLSRAGLTVAWVDHREVDSVRETPFDVVFMDQHGSEALLSTPLKARLIVYLQLDAVFLEAAHLNTLLRHAETTLDAPVVVWATCDLSRAWLERSGLPVSVFHQPFPVDGEALFLPPDRTVVAPGDRQDHSLSIADWITPQIAAIPEEERDRVFFAGAYPDPDNKILFPDAADRLDRTVIADFVAAQVARMGACPHFDSMVFFLDHFGLRLGEDTRTIVDLHQILVQERMLRLRVPAVKAVAEAFGDDFLLIGTGWEREGIASRPDNFEAPIYTGARYGVARANLDLGSSNLDIGWYERPIEVLRFGGRLVQRDCAESGALYGDLADAVVFHDRDGMLDLLARPKDPKRCAEIRDGVFARVVPQTVGETVMGQLEGRVTETGRKGYSAAARRSERLLRQRGAQDAVAAVQAILEKTPDDPLAIAVLGRAARTLGATQAGLDFAVTAAQARPEDPDLQYDLAQSLFEEGRGEDARAVLERTVARTHDHTPSNNLLARLRLPGQSYLQVLHRIHRLLRPETYLEIGVMYGDSLSLAWPDSHVIGIDPEPRIQVPLTAGTEIHAVTSDAFFAARPSAAEPLFDLAFVDGLHTFDQTLLDIANLERCSKPGAVILFHDCLPLTPSTATRTQETEFWSGDTWKVVPLLAKYRPDLTLMIVPAFPTGLGVIANLKSENRVLIDNWGAVFEEGIALPYPDGRPRDGVTYIDNSAEAIDSLFADLKG